DERGDPASRGVGRLALHDALPIWGGVVAGRAEQMKEVVGFLRTAGPTLSPFNAWVFLKGLETLRLRMQAHCAAAQQLAEWLEQQDRKSTRLNSSHVKSSYAVFCLT